MTIREKLTFLLDQSMTCGEVAKASKCHVSTIYRVRDGIIKNPSYSIGIAIDKLYQSIKKSGKHA